MLARSWLPRLTGVADRSSPRSAGCAGCPRSAPTARRRGSSRPPPGRAAPRSWRGPPGGCGSRRAPGCSRRRPLRGEPGHEHLRDVAAQAVQGRDVLGPARPRPVLVTRHRKQRHRLHRASHQTSGLLRRACACHVGEPPGGGEQSHGPVLRRLVDLGSRGGHEVGEQLQRVVLVEDPGRGHVAIVVARPPGSKTRAPERPPLPLQGSDRSRRTGSNRRCAHGEVMPCPAASVRSSWP